MGPLVEGAKYERPHFTAFRPDNRKDPFGGPPMSVAATGISAYWRGCFSRKLVGRLGETAPEPVGFAERGAANRTHPERRLSLHLQPRSRSDGLTGLIA